MRANERITIEVAAAAAVLASKEPKSAATHGMRHRWTSAGVGNSAAAAAAAEERSLASTLGSEPAAAVAGDDEDDVMQ